MERAIPMALRMALEAYRERLRACFGDRLRDVRLFGSWARGEANANSDVDVLVLVDNLTDLEIGIAAGEAAHVIMAFQVDLAPLPMSTARLQQMRDQERLLATAIDREGISL